MANKSVIITGASRGIGKQLALKYASEGYNVAINCKNSQNLLNNLVEEIRNFGVLCKGYIGDVGEFNFVAAMFQDILTHFGSIDILINNAGISSIGLLSDMTYSQWNEVIHTNLTSAFNCCHEIIPHMVSKKSGQIINISSVWGEVGASMEVAYSASKAGLNGFTKALAKELAPSNIQVNAISFGLIDTQMNQFFTEEETNAIIDDIPANRIGTKEEAAKFIYQLTHGGHSYLTGQVIRFDGGWI